MSTIAADRDLANVDAFSMATLKFRAHATPVDRPTQKMRMITKMT
jgi:hypothetical protein